MPCNLSRSFMLVSVDVGVDYTQNLYLSLTHSPQKHPITTFTPSKCTFKCFSNLYIATNEPTRYKALPSLPI